MKSSGAGTNMGKVLVKVSGSAGTSAVQRPDKMHVIASIAALSVLIQFAFLVSLAADTFYGDIVNDVDPAQVLSCETAPCTAIVVVPPRRCNKGVDSVQGTNKGEEHFARNTKCFPILQGTYLVLHNFVLPCTLAITADLNQFRTSCRKIHTMSPLGKDSDKKNW